MKRLEVAILVEHVVGRQQRLAEELRDAPAVDERRAVEERPSFVGRIRLGNADEHRRHPDGIARQRLQHFAALADERGAEKEVARQIADERELRRHREIGAGVRRFAQRVHDQRPVALEIANRRVDLQQGDLHVVVRS